MRVIFSAVGGAVICLIGCFMVLGLTIYTAVDYWLVRGDVPNAVVTVAFELIAFGGIAAAVLHFGPFAEHPRVMWFFTICATLAAAAWCAFVQIEKLKADSHALAVAAVEKTEIYKMTLASLTSAQEEADGWSDKDPPPTCTCPVTIRAWQATHAAEATRLEGVVAERQRRLQALIPPPRVDLIAILRGVLIELTKLFGLAFFGGGLGITHGARKPAAPSKADVQPTLKPAPERVRATSRAGKRGSRPLGGSPDFDFAALVNKTKT